MKIKDNRPTFLSKTNSSKLKSICEPNKHDILCGRGNAAKFHTGNVSFRKLVSHRKTEYRMHSHPYERKEVSLKIFEEIKKLNPPGRFLAMQGNEWYEINESKALGKISQALRELVTNNQDLDMDTLKKISLKSSNPNFSKLASTTNSTKRKLQEHRTNVDTECETRGNESAVNNSVATGTVHQTSNDESIDFQSIDQVNVKQKVIMPLSKHNISVTTDVNLHSKLRYMTSEEAPTKQQSSVTLSQGSQYCKSNKDEKKSQQLKPPPKKQATDTSANMQPAVNSRLNKHSKEKMLSPIHPQKILLPLSYIGKSFLTSTRSEESKYVFEDIADLGQREDALLCLPSIMGSLCKRLRDLEDQL